MKWINKTSVFSALGGFFFAVSLMVGGVALAHHGGHGKKFSPEKIEKHLGEMKEKLGLSAAQEQDIRTIMADARTQFEALKGQERSKEKFLAMRDIKWSTEDRIHETLTCEQREGLRKLKREKRAEHMKKRREHRRERREGRRGNPDGN